MRASVTYTRRNPDLAVLVVVTVSSAARHMQHALTSEFAVLKDRAQQLFDGLRDLPPYGQKLWEPYFHRTFDVYNKLWSARATHTHCTRLPPRCAAG